ncbi:SWIM zinc finger family protein [Bacillus sp. FSL K6-3431]|uniref:SWIM zinc finger family protein n=1 Tax=Bacillus sp. FSL K6-3431 TaxID=2921500 RepID=UPI0030F6D73C
MYNRQLLDHIKLYSEELQSILDPRTDAHQKLVQKGMILFRQQLVYGVKFSNGKVEAKVRDVTPVKVELVFENMVDSTCTCPTPNICKHQIALFFNVLSRTQSIFLWMQEWKDRWQVNDVLSTLQRGSDLLKTEQSYDETGPEQWLTRIREAYHHVSEKNFYQLEDWARVCYRRLLGFAPVEREWKPLFQLFAAYESLKVINAMSNEPGKHRHVSAFIQQMLEEAEEALTKLATTASPFAFDEYFHYLREKSATLLEEETMFSTEFTDMYMKLWTFLFKNKRDRLTEQERLHKLSASNNDSRIEIAAIHLAILLENDEWALDHISQLGPDIAPFALRWLKLLQAERSKKRMTVYLPAFITQIIAYISTLSRNYEQAQFTRSLFQVLDSDTAMKLDPSLLEKIYIQLLPHSRFQYIAYLLDKQEFRKWVELQVFTDNNLEYIDRHTVDIVAKHDPGALRPLYHETITGLLKHRSRDSYKKAVRYLKRLQKLYKKEKKMPQWELYFAELQRRTKRLRAFQEECRKGKLINDES